MPMYDADYVPARPPRRVIVAGTSGAGKTTLANRIAESLGLARVDLDSLYHGPGWVPRESFIDDVDSFTSQDTWALEWNYSQVRFLVSERADLLVWLDLPVRTVMTRLIRRTLTRRVRRQELWNGNYEPPLHTFFTDKDHVVRWGWRTRKSTPERVYRALEISPELPVVRLGSANDVERWVGRLLL